MKQRWFQLLVAMFPASARGDRGDEILEALDESEPTAAQFVRESVSLVWANSVAWSRYLRSADGLWRSAYVGAVLWFGFLVSIGPLLRLRFVLAYGSAVPGAQTGWPPFAVTVALSVFVILLMRRSRGAAAVVGLVAIGAAAGSNVVGSWGFAESGWYEARWLGVALAIAVALGRRVSAERPPPVWAPLIGVVALAGGVMALPWQPWSGHASRNYGVMLQWNLLPELQSYFIEWVSLVVVVVALVALFFHPMPAALIAPTTLHLVAVSPGI